MKRLNSFLGVGVLGLMIGLGSMTMVACGDDDDDATAGKGGTGGKGGSGGTGGTAGGGTGGTAGGGTGGTAGGGTGGASGAAGSGGSAGAAGNGGGGDMPQFVLPGVGATLKCGGPKGDSNANAATVYGKDNLIAVSKAIVDATVAELDPEKGNGTKNLGDSFSKSTPQSLEALGLSLGNFLFEAYGGDAGTYTGASMFNAHKGMAITSAQYDYFVGQVAAPTVIAALALVVFGGDEDAATEEVMTCVAPALVDPKLKADIVEE